MHSITQGETFTVQCRWFDQETGTPNDLTGVEVSAQIEWRCFCAPLTVVVTDAADGRFTLSGPTDEWPSGMLDIRIRYSTPGGDVIPEALPIAVLRGPQTCEDCPCPRQ